MTTTQNPAAGQPSHQSANNGAQEEDQWTFIVRKGKGKKLSRQQQNKKYHYQNQHPRQNHPQDHQLTPAAGPVDNFRPNAKPQLSAVDIQAQHEKIAARFRATPCCQKLIKLITAHAPSHVRITRAICLGLGPFDPEDGSWDAQRRSHVQLEAFLNMVAVLAKEGGMDIECFYQEPRFADPDKAFIASLGGKVVESPSSYDLMDGTTFVYGVHLYRDIWAAALDKELPGLYVGTGWDVWELHPAAEHSPDFRQIRAMDTSFTKLPFPQDDDFSFTSTCMYWKAETAKSDKADKSADTTLQPETETETEPSASASASDALSSSPAINGDSEVDALADSIGKLQTDG